MTNEEDFCPLFHRYQDICHKWTVWVVMAAVWLLGVTLGSLPTFGWNGSQKPKKRGESECDYFRIMDEDFLRYSQWNLSIPTAIG